VADAGSCTPAKLQLRHSASFCSCSLSGPTIPRNRLVRPLATISPWDFLTLISVPLIYEPVRWFTLGGLWKKNT